MTPSSPGRLLAASFIAAALAAVGSSRHPYGARNAGDPLIEGGSPSLTPDRNRRYASKGETFSLRPVDAALQWPGGAP